MPSRRRMDWLAPILVGLGLCLFAARVWAQGEGVAVPIGSWFDLVSSSPWIALSLAVLWDSRNQRELRAAEADKRLKAYQDGNAAAAETAETLRMVGQRLHELTERVKEMTEVQRGSR